MSRSSAFSVSTGRVVGRGVYQQDHSSCLCLEAGGGTRSRLLNEEAQLLLRWAEKQQILLLPQFVMGSHNVIADSLSRPNEVVGSEWTLAQEVVDQLGHRFVCDGDEPSVAGVFCSDGGPCVGGHGRSSAMLGPSPSVCFSSVTGLMLVIGLIRCSGCVCQYGVFMIKLILSYLPVHLIYSCPSSPRSPAATDDS